MNYYSGSAKNGPFEQAYEDNWKWSKKKGSYEKGSDFFDIHWEVHDCDPFSIRLHVESPNATIDPTLNQIKEELISALSLAGFQHIASSHAYGFKEGRYILLGKIQSNKSTEPFRILITDSLPQPNHRQNLDAVHAVAGTAVDEVVKQFAPRLDSYFGR